MPELIGTFNLRKFKEDYPKVLRKIVDTGNPDNMPDLEYTIGDGETEENIRSALRQNPDYGLERFERMNSTVFKDNKPLAERTIHIPFYMVYYVCRSTQFAQNEVR